jgi:CheY-like chemotaxis protein
MTTTNAAGSPAEFVQLSVADTGCGIPAEIVGRVFEPFFTTKDISKGSGLGLPQVYGFALQSGGRVSIASTVGAGTTVTVLLPRSGRIPADPGKIVHAAMAAPALADSGRHGQVLLVEDDAEVSAVTIELLTSLGFSVTHVESAEAALQALANSPRLDVVLSDIMMPGGISGLQLAREIRRRQPGLPVVLITGYAEAAAEMEDGEFKILLKPFGLDALSAALGVDVS